MWITDDERVLEEFAGPGVLAERRAVDSLDAPDRLLSRGLAIDGVAHVAETTVGGGFWRRVVVVTRAPTSQFDVLGDSLGQVVKSVGPVACLALAGREFHGQRGRPWSALDGNLHVSVGLAPGLDASRVGSAFTMLPAVAAVDAVREATGGRLVPDIKWVNDLLLDGRKVAGVLTRTQVLGTRFDVVVMGMGLNVTRTPQIDPSPFVPAVTSLHEHDGGRTVTRALVFRRILDALATHYEMLVREGPDSLFAMYQERSIVVGRKVCIWEESLVEGTPPSSWPGPLARGVVTDLAPDLSLGLEGRGERIRRGRLAFDDVCGAEGL